MGISYLYVKEHITMDLTVRELISSICVGDIIRGVSENGGYKVRVKRQWLVSS